MAATVSNMTYEEKVDALYTRRDAYFQDKVTNGSVYYSEQPLLKNELEAVWYGMRQPVGDGLTPHHMPSANSIAGDGIAKKVGACSIVAEQTHMNTFTYGMSDAKREYDAALYNALNYKDRLEFDQYDLLNIYVDTRPNVDIEVVEAKLQEQYEMALEVKRAQESSELEQVKAGTC